MSSKVSGESREQSKRTHLKAAFHAASLIKIAGCTQIDRSIKECYTCCTCSRFLAI